MGFSQVERQQEVFDPFTVALDPPVKACQVNCAV
jgi:hypothetical protein